MQNSNQTLGNKFDNIYFHAKFKVKSLKYHKIKRDTSLKSYDYAEFKSRAWKQI